MNAADGHSGTKLASTFGAASGSAPDCAKAVPPDIDPVSKRPMNSVKILFTVCHLKINSVPANTAEMHRAKSLSHGRQVPHKARCKSYGLYGTE